MRIAMAMAGHAYHSVQTLTAHWIAETKHMNWSDQNKRTQYIAASERAVEDSLESIAPLIYVLLCRVL